jgi:hypothetical protein
MWIRSQDKKTLIKPQYINIENDYRYDSKTIEEYISDGYLITVNERSVGKYNSIERAIEIMDKIQENIQADNNYSEPNGTVTFYGEYTYQMPKE